MFYTLALILLLASSLALTLYLKISLLWGFLFIAFLLLALSSEKRSNITFAIDSVKSCYGVYGIVALLGMNVAMWMSSGLLATIIYHGLNFIIPELFLVSAFLFSAAIAFIMGTGLGTFSTIGMVFLSLSTFIGLNPALVIGALVSGAFIADKLSFASALTQLNLKVTESNYKKYFFSSMKTLLPGLIITALIYYYLTPNQISIDSRLLLIEKQHLAGLFNLQNILLLLPLLFVLLSFIGVSSKISLSLMIFFNALSVIFIQGESLKKLTSYLILGYNTPENTLFHGGGLLPMVEVILIVIAAVFVTGVIKDQGLLNPILEKAVKHCNSPSQLVLKTGLLSIFLTAISCDQTVGILIPGDYFKKYYKERHIETTLLARTLSDSGIITAPLEFWNVNALIIFSLTGVSALSYGPYAILCYLMPVLTWFVTVFSYRKNKFNS